jgi:uncharacterized membrane protein YccC
MLSVFVRRLPAWVLNGISVTLGLTLVQCSIGAIAGFSAAQIAIANAVCASLADVVTTTDRVARRVLAALICSTVSATLFFAVRPFGGALIPAVALISFGAMLTLSWGPKAAPVAFATMLSLVFAMSSPDSTTLMLDRFGWGLAGSAGYWVWAVVSARLLQPSWRNHALAATAEGMSGLMASVARQVSHPSDAIWRSEIIDAEAALADQLQSARDLIFGNDQGPDAKRETVILLKLIDLRDLAMASDVMAPFVSSTQVDHRIAELAGRIMQGIADAVHELGEHLRTGNARAVGVRIEESIEHRLAELERAVAAEFGPATEAVASLLKGELDLLRALQQLLFKKDLDGLPCGRVDLRRYISPDEWRLAAVKSNMRLDAPVLRHAVRTSLTVTIAYAVANALSLTPHPQWVVLTVAAVMQGSLAQTLTRRDARVLGTLAGCFVVLLLTTNSSVTFLSGCFLVAAGVAHAFFGVHYAVTAGAAAVMAVLQAHLVAPDAGFGTLERFGDTVAGALPPRGRIVVAPIELESLTGSSS